MKISIKYFNKPKSIDVLYKIDEQNKSHIVKEWSFINQD